MAEPHESRLIKLLFLGNSGVGKTSLMRKFAPNSNCHSELMKPSGIDYTARTIQLDNNEIVKLQIWKVTVQQRFRTIPKTFYQAKGFIMVYDVTNNSSFTEISHWLRNIKEDHANIKKILVGNKADKDESERSVSTARGQALAKEYGIEFFETSAETNMNVEEVFFSIARNIMLELRPIKLLPGSVMSHEPQTFGNNNQLNNNKLRRNRTG